MAQIMACRLIGTKPLSEPVLKHSWLYPRNKRQHNFNRNSYTFIQENSLKYVLKGGGLNVIFMVSED